MRVSFIIIAFLVFGAGCENKEGSLDQLTEERKSRITFVKYSPFLDSIGTASYYTSDISTVITSIWEIEPGFEFFESEREGIELLRVDTLTILNTPIYKYRVSPKPSIVYSEFHWLGEFEGTGDKTLLIKINDGPYLIPLYWWKWIKRNDKSPSWYVNEVNYVIDTVAFDNLHQ